MPNPMPPSDRKHGSGDRNDNDVARLDRDLQEPRDAERAKEAEQADREAKRKQGFDHP
jgi:hypothetical protein